MRDVLHAKDHCQDFHEMVTCCNDAKAKLVDCFLALALVRGFDMALFVLQVYEDAAQLKDDEARLIRSHDATNMRHGLNCRRPGATTSV